MTLQFADLPFDEMPYDENGCNKWEKSSIRRNMNSIAFKERFEEGFRRLLIPVLKEKRRQRGNTGHILPSVRGRNEGQRKEVSAVQIRTRLREVNPEQGTEWHWTRSASRGSAYYTWYVSASGYVYNSHAVNSFRFAPACVIGAKAIK